jgi:hypothetical protein
MDDSDPDVLQLNVIEFDCAEAYLKKDLVLTINREEYEGKKLLVVPRCCQKREGTTDRRRVNEQVARYFQAQA